MQAIVRFTPSFFTILQKAALPYVSPRLLFHSVINQSTPLANPGGLFNISVRNHIRNNFPRPCERKRVKVLGWVKRMSTPGGRRVLMRRILKGRFVYSH